MGMFTADIAATLQIALISMGFIVLHFSQKENSFNMKAGAMLMIIGGILGFLCTAAWTLKYHAMGVFNNPSVTTMHVEQHDGDARHHYPPDQE